MRSDDVMFFTGASRRQLDHWCTKGWVTPSITASIGSGQPREWSVSDAVRVAVMQRLCQAGVTVSEAAWFVNGGGCISWIGWVDQVERRDGPVSITVDVEAIRTAIADRMDLGRVA